MISDVVSALEYLSIPRTDFVSIQPSSSRLEEEGGINGGQRDDDGDSLLADGRTGCSRRSGKFMYASC